MVDERSASITDRRDFPRVKGAFQVRFGICGGHRREVPGFTGDLSLGGISFLTPETTAKAGDHVAVEVGVPGFEGPLYFLGEVVRVHEERGGYAVAVRFDWLGKSDSYREMLKVFLDAHA